LELGSPSGSSAVSLCSLRENFTLSTNHRTGWRKRKKGSFARLLKANFNSTEKERRYGKKTKGVMSTSKT
jgi:hypothetical protein